MTPDPHWCPVEDCEFGVDESRTLGSVRSHINAETSEGHDWNALRDQVHNQEQAEPDGEQREAGETSPSEQPENASEGAATDGSETDEGEPGGEQAEGGETSPSEQTENGSEMATPEEYDQQQQAQQAESSDKGEQSGDSGGDTEAGGSNPPTTGVPAPSTRTLVLVVGAVAVGVAVYWLVLRDEDDATTAPTTDVPSDEDDQEDRDEANAAADSGGGLWDE